MLLRVAQAVLILLGVSGSALAEAPLTVFAAASMSEAMEEIGAAFERDTGTKVVLSFAGTGTLARQIEAGAPADVFVAADRDWMDYAVKKGAVDAQMVEVIASNRLVLIGTPGAAALDLTPEAIDTALGEYRMAIADPDTVPAGRYGKAALEKLGLWKTVETRLAPMENVRVALASVARGDTPLGLVYATDAAVEPNVAVVAEIPQKAHPRIVYPAALTSHARNGQSSAFLRYLKSPDAQTILQSLGFVTDKDG